MTESYLMDDDFIRFLRNLNSANIPYVVFKSYQYRQGRFSEKDLDIYIDKSQLNEALNYCLKDKSCRMLYENPLERKVKLLFRHVTVDIYTYIGKKNIALFLDIKSILQRRVQIKVNDTVIYVLNPVDDFFIRCIILPFEVRLMNFNEIISALREDIYYLLKMKDPYQLVAEFVTLSLKSRYAKSSLNILYTVMRLVYPKMANLYVETITKIELGQLGTIKDRVCSRILRCIYAIIAIFVFNMIFDIARSPYLSPIKKVVEVYRFILKMIRHLVMIIILDFRDTLKLRGKILW